MTQVNIKKGFTLIELLVVIAIIAILAAILFPVFAQAKQSAKKISSLSNNKQIALAAIMYGADYDDNIPLFHNGSLANVRGTALPRADSWVWLIQPYIKNLQLMVDPGRGDTIQVWGSGPLAWYGNQNRFPLYGINYLFVAPFPNCDNGESRSFTQADAPAETVFFTESRLFNLDDNRGYYAANAPGMWPNIAPHAVYCIYWDGSACSGDWCGSSTLAKKMTASVSTFYGQGPNVTWIDGHAKYLKDSGLAAGTDYTTAVPGGLANGGGAVITDKTKYLWNLDGNYYGG